MFALVKADDWEGLYIKRKLWYEEHHIELSVIKMACKKFKLDIDDLEEYWVTDEYYDNVLSEVGNFPENLDEVELA